MPAVSVKMGNIFDGAADLTVLPCSAKGTYKSARIWIDTFKLPKPDEIDQNLKLGHVTEPFAFPGPQRLTKYIAYAASVLNDATTAEAIRDCGRRLGDITNSHSSISIVEAPLLGSGHGQLPAVEAAASLAIGFKESARADATLWIFVFDYERYATIAKALQDEGAVKRLIDSVQLRPGWGGISIDLKHLLKLDRN